MTGVATRHGTIEGMTKIDPPADRHDLIRVQGARVNNLKDISLEIPKRRLTAFTGVSGSGKSSLVFGTIAAESQRLINRHAGAAWTNANSVTPLVHGHVYYRRLYEVLTQTTAGDSCSSPIGGAIPTNYSSGRAPMSST